MNYFNESNWIDLSKDCRLESQSNRIEIIQTKVLDSRNCNAPVGVNFCQSTIQRNRSCTGLYRRAELTK